MLVPKRRLPPMPLLRLRLPPTEKSLGTPKLRCQSLTDANMLPSIRSLRLIIARKLHETRQSIQQQCSHRTSELSVYQCRSDYSRCFSCAICYRPSDESRSGYRRCHRRCRSHCRSRRRSDRRQRENAARLQHVRVDHRRTQVHFLQYNRLQSITLYQRRRDF